MEERDPVGQVMDLEAARRRVEAQTGPTRPGALVVPRGSENVNTYQAMDIALRHLNGEPQEGALRWMPPYARLTWHAVTPVAAAIFGWLLYESDAAHAALAPTFGDSKDTNRRRT